LTKQKTTTTTKQQYLDAVGDDEDECLGEEETEEAVVEVGV
jgi:hypothetical protein